MRDEKNTSLLEEHGWKVLVVWECELKKECLADRMDLLINQITTVQSG